MIFSIAKQTGEKMFNANKMQLIRSSCLPDFESFLKKISVSVPNWNNGDEFQIYRELDGEITKKICRLMESSSIIDGYTKLLDLGGVSYNFSETDNELLEKIINNKEKIFQGGMIEKNLQPPQKPIDNLEIKISRAEKFDTSEIVKELRNLNDHLKNTSSKSLLEKLLKRLAGIRDGDVQYARYSIDDVTRKIQELNLFEVKKFKTVPLKNLTGTIQEYSSAFIEVKKSSQPVRQPEPPKTIFSTDKLEKIFEVLEQVNRINKFI